MKKNIGYAEGASQLLKAVFRDERDMSTPDAIAAAQVYALLELAHSVRRASEIQRTKP